MAQLPKDMSMGLLDGIFGSGAANFAIQYTQRNHSHSGSRSPSQCDAAAMTTHKYDQFRQSKETAMRSQHTSSPTTRNRSMLYDSDSVVKWKTRVTPKTFQEELQEETDKWLKGVKIEF